MMPRPTPRTWRLLLLLFICIGMLPLAWVNRPLPEPDYDSDVSIHKLENLPEVLGEFSVAGVWELTSNNSHFGGYSALLAISPGSLLAASDAGRVLEIPIPLRATIPAGSLRIFDAERHPAKLFNDIESLAFDADSGTIWAGYESFNQVARMTKDGSHLSKQPPAIADWNHRSGLETFERLADGSFLMIAEGRGQDGNHEALLYPSDPLEGGEPLHFRFEGVRGMLPTGATLLPDGRVMILMRRFNIAILPYFSGSIMLADPAEISDGGTWSGEVIARFEDPFPLDNYEGIAAVPRPDGRVTVWLISDDNFSALQRTLLAKLVWPADRMDAGHEKARGKPARPSVSDRSPPKER